MDETLLIRPAGLDDINTIGFLAQQIWPVTYGNTLPPDQLKYMLKLMYSPRSLRRQMVDEHHQFLLVEQDEEPIGFASWSTTPDPGIYKLHKIYVLPSSQGKGLGRTLLQFIFETIRAEGATKLQLNVKRDNDARLFYERMGFAILEEINIDIGHGYFMRDYVMEADLG
jgi:ribosomal protein S18 acetylase RimI-like enzyme